MESESEPKDPLTIEERIYLNLFPSKKLPVKELVRLISIERKQNGVNMATVSKILGALEEMELVSSDRSGEDKRQVYYFLTDDGRDEARITNIKVNIKKFRTWNEKDRETFWAFLGWKPEEKR